MKRCSDIDLTKWLQNNLRAEEIISTLKNDKQGLKAYLFNHFEDDDIHIINELFNHAKNVHGDDLATIISPQRITHGAKTFALKFLQTAALILHTFKYLNLKNLNMCPCVSSVWMYHAFNPVCLNYYRHDRKNNQNVNNMSRMLQRFSHIEYLTTAYCTTWQENFHFISSLKRVTILEINISSTLLSTLFKALEIIANGIKMISLECEASPKATDDGLEFQLYLPHAQHVQFRYRYSSSHYGVFPIIVSNQCQTIWLQNAIITHSWGEKVTKAANQDYLSCLNVLMLENVQIELSVINTAAKIFSNTKHLRLDRIRLDMLQMWLGMKNYMYSNNIKVTITYFKPSFKQFTKDRTILRATLFEFIKKILMDYNATITVALI